MTNDDTSPVWLTTADLAERYHTSAGTVRYWRTLTPPYGPPGIRVGKRVLFALADVEAWEAARRAEAGASPGDAAERPVRGHPRRAREA